MAGKRVEGGKLPRWRVVVVGVAFTAAAHRGPFGQRSMEPHTASELAFPQSATTSRRVERRSKTVEKAALRFLAV